MKPITPEEARKGFEESTPDFVFEAVNNCINKNFFNKKSFTIKQNEIIEEILKLAPEPMTRQEIFNNHWLDFEPHYRKAGWYVVYDKPSYCDSYEAYFKFSIDDKL